MTLEQQVSDSNRAREVLENEAYQAAFASIQAEILEQWKTSPARDADGREKLWLMLSLLDKLQRTLESVLSGGKHAMAELRHKQTLAERARGLLKG